MRNTGEKGQYSRVSSVELAKVTHEKMTRAKALSILELKGLPSPKIYDDQQKKLLGKMNPSTELVKIAAVHAAHSRLQTDHQAAVQDMENSLNVAYDAYQDPSHTKEARDLGKRLVTLGRKYCKDLAAVNADMPYLEQTYQTEFVKILNVSPDLKKDLEKLMVKISVAYEHIFAQEEGYVQANSDDMAMEMEEVVFVDPIDLFRAEYNHYLDDLVNLQQEEQEQLMQAHQDASQPVLFNPRYQKDLQQLYVRLDALGSKYFAAIGEDPDETTLVKLNQKFRQDFKQAVDEAKQAFAKEPGIWANLNCTLKILFTIIFVVGIVILLCEKPEDRHRLFHGAPAGELNIKQAWQDWEMDVLPDPEATSVLRHKNV